VCPHGRPLYCLHRHAEDDRRLGEPLCADCYDYVGHVLWQWHVPELWRRFTIRLGRTLARQVGLTAKEFQRLARVSYAKAAEFQARGLIHAHAVMRLDGPTGPESPPGVDLDALARGAAIEHAARVEYLDVQPEGYAPRRLRWGDQLDTRSVTLVAGRDDPAGEMHPEQLAAYVSKYITKGTEDFGLDGHGRVHSATDAHYIGASSHAVRIIETAEQLAAVAGDDYERLADRYCTLGYRGHVLTKTRRYSTTFGTLRRARSDWRQYRRPPGIDPSEPETDEDQAGDESDIVVERQWRYVGSGFLDADEAALAMTSAAMARSR
jgi:hypothetical protein